MLTQFSELLAKRTLRYHCGHDMFCRGCHGILDARRAVEIDVLRRSTQELVATRVICATCFDAKCSNGRIEATIGSAYAVAIVDGRKLFARKRTTAATA